MSHELKTIREAALLRNRIETCLRASSSPMTGREIANYLVDVIGTNVQGYSRLRTLFKRTLYQPKGRT